MLFSKTRREAPRDEVAKNAQLLIRAGYVHKEMAGVYDFLPLGLRTLKKIEHIIREEMNAIGGQEVLLSSLQDPAPWQASGRWDDAVVDVWFKTRLHHGEAFHQGSELGLASTHEEPMVRMMKHHIASHKDLPQYVYQFQTKFRNEVRAKSGVMRTREFVMKDLYSFSKDEQEFRAFYEQVAAAYLKVFARCGLGAWTFRTFASGGSFSKFSDEFQTVCEAGEDVIYVDEEKHIAVNEEVYRDEILREIGLEKARLQKKKAVEVGNIFPLGTKYSTALGLTYKNEAGEDVPVYMGSYGIGPARVMGAIAERYADEKGLVWPLSVAPFALHLVRLGEEEEVRECAGALYVRLQKGGMEVLYDDRPHLHTGEKLSDSDLLGIPYRLVVGKRSIAEGVVEWVERKSGSIRRLPAEKAASLLLDPDAGVMPKV